MKSYRIVIRCFALIALSVVYSQPAHTEEMELDTNRVGSDYNNFDLSQANPALCMKSCSADTRCKAWTYVKPGIQGASARCWLKTNIPAATPDTCCVSGVKAEKMEHDTDRAGSDYNNFDLPQANPALCMNSCNTDTRCKAWTYVKPGVQGSSARCWLKTSVPTATPATCCVSGVKQ